MVIICPNSVYVVDTVGTVVNPLNGLNGIGVGFWNSKGTSGEDKYVPENRGAE